MITLGYKGKEVSQIQKYLSMLGYDLVIDGCFGNKTLRSIKAFQKKYDLLVDGISGYQTLEALKAAQKRTSKEEKTISYEKKYGNLSVISEYKLEPEQYIKQFFSKNKIFIHNSAIDIDAKKVIKNWDSNLPRISSAFVISGISDDDGQIYEAYNPDYWSYHLGAKGTKGKLERHSIGIDICTWGELDNIGGRFYNRYGLEISENEVYSFENKKGGKVYYHTYSDNQIKSLEELLFWLANIYNIKIQDIEFDGNWLKYNEKLLKKNTSGVWVRSNIRKDKVCFYSDVRMFEAIGRVKDKLNK